MDLYPAAIANQTSEVFMTIVRAGSLVATCTLVFDEIEDRGAAEYKLDLRSKQGALRSKSGFCDLDPVASGAQAGIPAVQSGDVVTLVDGNGSTLLTGAFGRGK